mmetsp:Transcript_9077/g.23486  ORF Transcript_9077/g.23486 Transcript_9077/m.23486 type:complete len:375 (-) Transcript_9077:203-1327(-)
MRTRRARPASSSASRPAPHRRRRTPSRSSTRSDPCASPSSSTNPPRAPPTWCPPHLEVALPRSSPCLQTKAGPARQWPLMTTSTRRRWRRPSNPSSAPRCAPASSRTASPSSPMPWTRSSLSPSAANTTMTLAPQWLRLRRRRKQRAAAAGRPCPRTPSRTTQRSAPSRPSSTPPACALPSQRSRALRAPLGSKAGRMRSTSPEEAWAGPWPGTSTGGTRATSGPSTSSSRSRSTTRPAATRATSTPRQARTCSSAKRRALPSLPRALKTRFRHCRPSRPCFPPPPRPLHPSPSSSAPVTPPFSTRCSRTAVVSTTPQTFATSSLPASAPRQALALAAALAQAAPSWTRARPSRSHPLSTVVSWIDRPWSVPLM